MDGDGIVKMFKDLNVDMEDPVTLLISMKMEAKAQGEYTYDMFKKGCISVGADDVSGWKSKVKELQGELKNNTRTWEKVYEFTFVFS